MVLLAEHRISRQHHEVHDTACHRRPRRGARLSHTVIVSGSSSNAFPSCCIGGRGIHARRRCSTPTSRCISEWYSVQRFKRTYGHQPWLLQRCSDGEKSSRPGAHRSLLTIWARGPRERAPASGLELQYMRPVQTALLGFIFSDFFFFTLGRAGDAPIIAARFSSRSRAACW
jgi:hypothetical protein